MFFDSNMQQLRRYDEFETKLFNLTGFTCENLLDLLMAGYTLQPPNKSVSLSELIEEYDCRYT